MGVNSQLFYIQISVILGSVYCWDVTQDLIFLLSSWNGVIYEKWNYWGLVFRYNLNKLPKEKIAAAKSLQSCLTLCDTMDCTLPGFSVHGILQARTLEWVAISFSNAWKGKVKVKSLSRVWLLVIPWTAAYWRPPSMGFSGQQYWSGVPLPSPKEKIS